MAGAGGALRAEDWTLLVLAEAHGGVLSPVQLQKSLFLLGENLDTGEGFYRFVAYDYGPFCKSVYTDAEDLAREGLVGIGNMPWGHRSFWATPEGLRAAEVLRARLSAEARDYMARVVEWVRKVSFKDLVMAIYEAYPSMRANSVFRY